MIKWEYHQVSLFRQMDDERIQARGRDGWELVSLAINHSEYFYVFKRPLT